MGIFDNPFFSIAGQKERLTNVYETLKAAVTLQGVQSNTGIKPVDVVLSSAASNPYLTAAVVAPLTNLIKPAILSPVVAPILNPTPLPSITKSFIPPIVVAAGAGVLAGSLLSSAPKATAQSAPQIVQPQQVTSPTIQPAQNIFTETTTTNAPVSNVITTTTSDIFNIQTGSGTQVNENTPQIQPTITAIPQQQATQMPTTNLTPTQTTSPIFTPAQTTTATESTQAQATGGGINPLLLVGGALAVAYLFRKK